MTKNHDAASFSYISIAYLMDYARGKHDFLVKMLQLLHEQTPIAVDGIQKAIEASNWEEVRALAHKVKPNIHLLGNPSMDKLIYEIEHNAEQLHQLNTMPELYNQFNNIYQKAYCELTKALETYSKKL
jgi:HPt (histidine-containing phosphotransfer) domain-containing protein